MRGFVPTPDSIVDRMVEKLFDGRPPTIGQRLLDPGCGSGAFIEGVIRWADAHGHILPTIVGYESDRGRYEQAVRRFRSLPRVRIICADFLNACIDPFDYVVGNPPYVAITKLLADEKKTYRRRFASAEGRFDLYLLFFEQALRLLNLGGRLVFVTPEKFLYVQAARSFRSILANYYVREIELLDEDTFESLLTYPTVTTVDSSKPASTTTTLRLRNGSKRQIIFPRDGSSLQPLMNNYEAVFDPDKVSLRDVCARISCGVATGADSVFVQKDAVIDPELARYAYPTISGRDLSMDRSELHPDSSMLIPYDRPGRVLPLPQLGALSAYLSQPRRRERLEARTCTAHKPWYAFHDSAPLQEILRPKLLCKDIAATPHFWIDRDGSIVPRHSVYYIVPLNPAQIEDLGDYLNGPEAAAWLRAHCQRASKGFLRLQSSILKQLPIPRRFASKVRPQRPIAGGFAPPARAA